MFYKNYTSSQLETEVILLNTAVNTFSVQDFKRVQEFDAALTKAKSRVDNTVSVVSLLDELDRITAQPIQINELSLERRGDQDLFVTLNFSTETLDAALFQRKVVTTNSSLFSDLKIVEVDLQNAAAAQEVTVENASPGVTFIAEFTTPLTSVLYDPQEARRSDAGVGESSSGTDLLNSIQDFTSEEVVPLEALEFNETAL